MKMAGPSSGGERERGRAGVRRRRGTWRVDRRRGGRRGFAVRGYLRREEQVVQPNLAVRQYAVGKGAQRHGGRGPPAADARRVRVRALESEGDEKDSELKVIRKDLEPPSSAHSRRRHHWGPHPCRQRLERVPLRLFVPLLSHLPQPNVLYPESPNHTPPNSSIDDIDPFLQLAMAESHLADEQHELEDYELELALIASIENQPLPSSTFNPSADERPTPETMLALQLEKASPELEAFRQRWIVDLALGGGGKADAGGEEESISQDGGVFKFGPRGTVLLSEGGAATGVNASSRVEYTCVAFRLAVAGWNF